MKAYLIKRGCEDILKDPTRIFNLDETGFSLDPGTGKVLVLRGMKNCFIEQSNKHKSNITILATVRADGVAVSPLVIYPRKRISFQIVENMKKIPDEYDFTVGKSESGYINMESFYEYMMNDLDKWLTENNVQRPVLIYTDWHESRCNRYLSQALDAKEIILIGLLPNTTHLLQPLDVCVFFPLKAAWRKAAREYIKEDDEFIKQETFANVAIPLYYKYVTKKNIESGFRKCGLYPFDDVAPDFSKLEANTARKRPSTTLFEGISQGNNTNIHIKYNYEIKVMIYNFDCHNYLYIYT